MKQVDNNLAVLTVAYWMRNYNDCNPDVGMGPSWEYFVDNAIASLQLTKVDVDYDKIIREGK